MRGWVSGLACVGALIVGSVACTSSTETANNTPASSPSTVASTPSASPSASPSSTPTSEPTSTPTTNPGGALPAITSLPFHNGEVGIGYLSVTLGAIGGTEPYSWTISGGTFPPGLTLSTDGVVSGKNTTAGQFGFTVKVTDSNGATATSPAGLTVFAALAVSEPCASQCTVGAGCTVCGNFGSISGGVGPYTYKVVGGGVPSGMTLTGLTLKGGFPQSPVGFSLAVQVSDQFTAAVVAHAYWYVYDPATLSAGNACNDSNFAGTCTASGWSYASNAPSDPSVIVVGTDCPIDSNCDPTLPIAFSAVAKGGTISIRADIPNTSTCQAPFQYQNNVIYTLALVDKSTCATTSRSNTADVSITLYDRPCG